MSKHVYLTVIAPPGPGTTRESLRIAGGWPTLNGRETVRQVRRLISSAGTELAGSTLTTYRMSYGGWRDGRTWDLPTFMLCSSVYAVDGRRSSK